MPKAAAKHITTHPPVDPVVELARELLRVWDADDGSQQAYSEKGEKVTSHVRQETQQQFGEWRDAIETLISFTHARGLEGALAQLALALGTVTCISASMDDKDEMEVIDMKLHRLIRSAMDVMPSALRTSIDPAVGSIVRIYGGNSKTIPKWIDRVDEWAEKGRTRRLQEDEGF